MYMDIITYMKSYKYMYMGIITYMKLCRVLFEMYAIVAMQHMKHINSPQNFLDFLKVHNELETYRPTDNKNKYIENFS